MTTLAPPLLRVAPAVETRRFFEEAQDLKAVLDRQLAILYRGAAEEGKLGATLPPG